MKQLVSLLAVFALGMLVYKHHTERVKAAAERAAAEAAAAARARIPKPKPQQLQAVALSRVIEPLYTDLFAPLDQNNPADLVPPMEITKERILDVRTHAEAAKQPVYEHGIALLNAMISLAEERTRTLEAVLKIAKGKSSLDGPTTTSTSTAFFTQTTVKRWEDEKSRYKAHLDQLFAVLRTAEREWNKKAGKDAPLERYDLPNNAPVLISVDELITTANPLERGAYDQRRIYPWRRSYYDRYGYPETYNR